MSVSFSGLTSGLNTDRIISQLLSIERQPIQRYNQDISNKESQKSVYQDLNTKTGSLKDAVESLTEPSTFKQKTASSSKSDFLDASVVDSDAASEGSNEVFVERLATRARVSSGQFINNQKMFGNASNGSGAGVTSISDFEMAEGSGTVNLDTGSTSDMLDQLSKSVDSTSEFTITVDPGDTSAGGDGNQEQSMTVDVSDYDSFQAMMDDVNSTFNRLEMRYDSDEDKFMFVPTNKTGGGGTGDSGNETAGGTTFTLQDTSGNFLSGLGITEDGTVHQFDTQQSTGTDIDGDGNAEPRNLLSIDGSDSFNNLLFTSNLSQNDGTIRINNTEIQWDSNGSSDDPSTINQLVDRINQQVDGVDASFNSSTDKITLETTGVGAGEIDVTDVSGGELADKLNLETESAVSGDQVQGNDVSGQDAKLEINDTVVTKSGNTFTSDGVQYNLKDVYKESNHTNDPIEVSVNEDTSSITSGAEEFVNKFNEVISFINEKSQEDAPDSPGDNSENQSGPLMGDITARTIKDRITDFATRSYADATDGGEIESLADVGIELVNPLESGSSQAGTLNFDKNEFQEALSDNPGQVRELFTALEDDSARGGAQDGAAVTLNSYLDGITGGNGIISDRIDGINRRIDSLNENIEDQEERVQRKRERLEQKFLRMEQSLRQLQNQQSFLGSRL